MKHLLNFDPATNFFDRYAVAKGLAKLITTDRLGCSFSAGQQATLLTPMIYKPDYVLAETTLCRFV